MNDNKWLEECKTIWTKIADLGNIKLHNFSVYDDRYITNKIGT